MAYAGPECRQLVWVQGVWRGAQNALPTAGRRTVTGTRCDRSLASRTSRVRAVTARSSHNPSSRWTVSSAFNAQLADLDLLRPGHRRLVTFSHALRRLSQRHPSLVRAADSVDVNSRKAA